MADSREEVQAAEVTPEAVAAALDVLTDHFDLGGYARVGDYLWSGQTPEQRQTGIAEMTAADRLADARVRLVVADAIRAALGHIGGAVGQCGDGGR